MLYCAANINDKTMEGWDQSSTIIDRKKKADSMRTEIGHTAKCAKLRSTANIDHLVAVSSRNFCHSQMKTFTKGSKTWTNFLEKPISLKNGRMWEQPYFQKKQPSPAKWPSIREPKNDATRTWKTCFQKTNQSIALSSAGTPYRWISSNNIHTNRTSTSRECHTSTAPSQANPQIYH